MNSPGDWQAGIERQRLGYFLGYFGVFYLPGLVAFGFLFFHFRGDDTIRRLLPLLLFAWIGLSGGFAWMAATRRVYIGRGYWRAALYAPADAVRYLKVRAFGMGGLTGASRRPPGSGQPPPPPGGVE